MRTWYYMRCMKLKCWNEKFIEEEKERNRERRRKRKEEREIERVISGQVLMRYYICMHFQWLMTLREKDERKRERMRKKEWKRRKKERKNEKLHPMTDDDGKLQLFLHPVVFNPFLLLPLSFISISFFLFPTFSSSFFLHLLILKKLIPWKM